MDGLLLISKSIGTPLYSRALEPNYGLFQSSSPSSHPSTSNISALSLSGLIFSLRVHAEALLEFQQDKTSENEGKLRDFITKLDSVACPNLQMSLSQQGEALGVLMHHPSLHASLDRLPRTLASYFNEHYAKECREGMVRRNGGRQGASRRHFRSVVSREIRALLGKQVSERVKQIVKQLAKNWDTNWMYLGYSHRFCEEMDSLMEREALEAEQVPLFHVDSNGGARFESITKPPSGKMHSRKPERIEDQWLQPGSPNHIATAPDHQPSSRVPRPPPGKPPTKRFQRKNVATKPTTLRRFSTYITDLIFRKRKNRMSDNPAGVTKQSQSDYYYSELAGEFQLYYSEEGSFAPLRDTGDFEQSLSMLYESARLLAAVGDSLSYLELQSEVSTQEEPFVVPQDSALDIVRNARRAIAGHKTEESQLPILQNAGRTRKQRTNHTATKLIFYRFGDIFVFFPAANCESRASIEQTGDENLQFIDYPTQVNIRRLIHQDLEQLLSFLAAMQTITKFHYDIQVSMPSEETLQENLSLVRPSASRRDSIDDRGDTI